MRIPISGFADLGFCELKVVHRFLEERKPVFHQNVYLGGAQHATSAEIDALKPHTTVTLDELLEALRDEESVIEFPSESVRVEFSSHGFTFSGRLDKLVKQGREAFVIDEKFTGGNGGQFHQKYAKQLSGYCYGLADGKTSVGGVALGEKVFAGLSLSGKIVERDIESRAQLGEPLLVMFDAQSFRPSLERFSEIMRGSFEARELACGNPARCAICEYRSECGHRC